MAADTHPPDDIDRPRAAVVFAGGDPLPPWAAVGLPHDAFVIAADSGVHHALAIEHRVDLVIGDLDSASPDALASAERAGAVLERHPVAKDRTDLELALDRAVEMGATRVIVVGGHGGRVDHFVANALLLAAPRYAEVDLEARVGAARLFAVHRAAELHGEPGELVTLLALGGPAEGVETSGLRYALDGETLLPGSTRGVSNELVAPRGQVRVGRGTLLVIQPDVRTGGAP